MPSPIWTPATPGEATLAGRVNQFLTGHSSAIIYAGTAPNTDPTLAGTADQVGNGLLAHKFSLVAPATLTRVGLALGSFAAGCDLLLSIQADSGSGTPSGTPLASCVIPAEWVADATVATAASPLCGFPLAVSLAGTTNYYVVLQAQANPLNAVSGPYQPFRGNVGAALDDVGLCRSTAGTGALIFSGATWTGSAWAGGSWAAQSYGYGVFLRVGVSGLLNLCQDDAGAKLTGYAYNSSNQLVNAYEWAQRAATSPFNILSRDDASVESSTGSWQATGNCSIAQSATFGLDGTHSLVMSSLAAGAMDAATGKTTASLDPVRPSSAYSAMAFMRPGSTVRNVQVYIEWYTSAGVFISFTGGSAVSEVSGIFTPCYVSGVSPSNAAYASILVLVGTTGAAGELHYGDCFGLFPGSIAQWSYPGLGIGSARALSYTSGFITGVA